jgi:uncharacterized protein
VPRLDRETEAEGPLVRGISGRGFNVDGNIYEGLFLTPQSADGWQAPPIAELTADHLQPILALEPLPEFVLLGTGNKLCFPPRALIAALEARGIGVETMDSRAAARTWGVLRAEDRWIVAALMPL